LIEINYTVLIKKSFRTLQYLLHTLHYLLPTLPYYHRTFTVLSTTRAKLLRKCSSNVTTVLLPYFKLYVWNIGHGCE